MKTLSLAIFSLCLVLTACNGSLECAAGPRCLATDSGMDAHLDAQLDAALDTAVRPDAADAAVDTAPADPCMGQCARPGLCIPTANTDAATDASVPDSTFGDARINEAGTHLCRTCLVDTDCATGFCDVANDRCLECDATHACPNNLMCNNANECVQCLEDTHCPIIAPACNAGTCSACTGNAQCSRFPGNTYCGKGADLGQCVGCTTATEALYCSSNNVPTSCLFDTATCSTTPTNSVGFCEECQTSSECSGGRVCAVLTRFLTTQTWKQCVQLATSTCPRQTSAFEQRIVEQSGLTPVCVPTGTTCEGLRDWNRQSCTENLQCGEGVGDSYCHNGLCNYYCSRDLDCPVDSRCGANGSCDFPIL